MPFTKSFILISIISVFLEIIFIFIEHFSYNKETPPIVKLINRSLMIICTVCATIILFVCLRICADMFIVGNIEKGVKMLVTSLVVAIGSYVLFVRRFIKTISNNNNHQNQK